MGDRIVVLLVLSFLLYNSWGQVAVFNNYSIDQGLASNSVYECNQDQYGYIWVTTENGVNRFDGANFETFTSEDGLADDEIFGTREDSEGRIWFLSFNGKLSYYLDGRLYNEHNDSRLSTLNFSFYLRDIYQDKAGNLWMASQNEGLKVVTKDLVLIEHFTNAIYNQISYFSEHDGDSLIAWKKYNKLLFKETSFLQMKELDFAISVAPKRCNDQSESLIKTKDGKDFIGSLRHGGAYTIGDVISENEVRCVAAVGSNNFWLGTNNAGLLQINVTLNSLVADTLLKQYSINHLFIDRENNFWVSTKGNGVFIKTTNGYWKMDQKDGLSYAHFDCVTKYRDHGVIIGGRDGKVNFVNHDGKVTSKVDLNNAETKVTQIRSLFVDEYSNIWAATDKGLVIYNQQRNDFKWFREVGACKDLNGFEKNKVLLATSEGAYIFEYTEAAINFEKIWNVRSNAINANSEGDIFIGTLDGLYFYKYNKVMKFKRHLNLLNYRISDIQINDEFVFVGTYGHGMVVFDNRDKVAVFKKGEGLPSNFINKINLYDDDCWIATERGAVLLQLTNYLEIEKKIHFSKSDGLLSNEINDICFNNDLVYMATLGGLTGFNWTKLINNVSPPSIYINKVEINGKDTIRLPKYELHQLQDHLEIHFTAISFESAGDVEFRYRMLGVDTEWQSTAERHATYSRLSPGDYIFEVMSISKTGIRSKTLATFKLSISPYFVYTRWFKVLLISVLSLFVLVVVFLRYRNLQLKTRMERQLINLEHKALMTQMNPHFLFNTMSSIQQFINTNDKRSANKYLARFAELMRRILNNSKSNVLSLKEEVETLNLYLEFEALRFDHKFDYSVNSEPNLDLNELKLPSMLIQPYVENSILHGLASLSTDSRGEVKVFFALKDENHFSCVIDDNGIGRKAAEKIRQKRSSTHESTAMENINERIKLFNKRLEKRFMFEIEVQDKYDDSGQATGTRVEVIIPINF